MRYSQKPIVQMDSILFLNEARNGFSALMKVFLGDKPVFGDITLVVDETKVIVGEKLYD